MFDLSLILIELCFLWHASFIRVSPTLGQFIRTVIVIRNSSEDLNIIKWVTQGLRF